MSDGQIDDGHARKHHFVSKSGSEDVALHLLVRDNMAMREFIKELVHPEGFGHAVTQEVRMRAGELLRGLNGKATTGMCDAEVAG